MNLRDAALSLTLTIVPLTGSAQKPKLQLIAGLGLDGARSPSSSLEYSNVVLPRMSAGLLIPLTPRVAILSGAGFQQNGFNSRQILDGEKPGDHAIITNDVRYRQVQIPLQISIEVFTRKRTGLELAAGMSYGFLLGASVATSWNHYRKYKHVSTDDFEYRPRISLLPNNSLLGANPPSYGALYLFNPALSASLTLRATDHYLLQAYGEYNLYDASTASVSQVNLYSFGLALGYRL